ncbi:MAG: hypothetical protein AB7P34_20140, partial [Vicinamibacterales bacterium]
MSIPIASLRRGHAAWRSFGRPLQASPEPFLKGVEADQDGICRRESMRLRSATCSLPGKFGGVDQDQPRRSLRATRMQG